MKLLLFVIACALVGTQAQFFGNQEASNIQNNQFGQGGRAQVSSGMFREKRQFFGSQSAKNIQNNQFASANNRVGGGMDDGGSGMGGDHASVHTDSGFTNMRAHGGGMFREKRQFFGNQQASNIQNNQFASANSHDGSGMGGGHASVHSGFTTMRAQGGMFRQKRQFFGNQEASNIQNNQFASANGGFSGSRASVNSGFTSMNARGGMFREKRQFFGNQQASNIQNNQFASASNRFGGGMDDGSGMGGGHASVHSGSTIMRAQGGMFRQKRQFFGNQQASNIQNNQFGSTRAQADQF